MKFIPKTEEELKKENNLPSKGIYDIQVVSQHTFGQYEFPTEDTISKETKLPMIQLAINVFAHDSEKVYAARDYLPSSPKMMWKLRQAAKTFGLLKDYDKGEMKAISFIGKKGKAEIVIKQDDKGVDRINIAKYIFEEPTIVNDDAIPF
jgi:hypothetical protein